MLFDDKEKILVGVNKYQSEENVRTNVQKIDQNSVQKQLNRLSKIKKDLVPHVILEKYSA